MDATTKGLTDATARDIVAALEDAMSDYNLPNGTTQSDLDREQNRDDVQPCEVCGQPTPDTWEDRKGELHAACYGRCQQRMDEDEWLDLMDQFDSYEPDYDILGEGDAR